MIGMTLRGCLRTASSLWFLLLSLGSSAIAITLGCSSDVLHHYHTHDNSNAPSSLNNGSYSTVHRLKLSSKQRTYTETLHKQNTSLIKLPGFIECGKGPNTAKQAEIHGSGSLGVASTCIQQSNICNDFRGTVRPQLNGAQPKLKSTPQSFQVAPKKIK